MPAAKDIFEVLSDKIAIGDGCWEWTGALSTTGYGKLFRKGKVREAHRVVYELMVGPIPEGLDIDHLCRNRRCVRPAHMEPVTRRVNVLRGESLAAQWAKRSACNNGHPFTEENTRWESRGGRVCRSCERVRHARDRARRSEK